MAAEETIFGIVRRRESIRAFAAQASSLPTPLAGSEGGQRVPQEKLPAEALKQDLESLKFKKSQHLSIPPKKGSRKMNRLSFLGLFLGLLMAGAVFFVGGFLLCYSLYPPYGGVVFHPKYASVEPGKSLPPSLPGTENSLPPASVPQKSYTDRQALLASVKSSEKPGLLEKAQQRSLDNVAYQMRYLKDQFKDSLLNKVRGTTSKLEDKLAPVMGSLGSPLTQDLPNQIAEEQIENTFHPLEEEKASASSSSPDHQPKSSSPGATLASASGGEASLASAPVEKKALYSLRIRKFDQREPALKLAEELQRKGFEGYVVPLWAGDHLQFEVREGKYEQFSQAQNGSKALRGQGVELTTVIMIGRDEEHIKP